MFAARPIHTLKWFLLAIALFAAACQETGAPLDAERKESMMTGSDKDAVVGKPDDAENTADLNGKVKKSEEEWKKELSEEAFRVLRKKGTERAFTGTFWDHKETGTYVCAGCGQPLFASGDKFESGTGWPSFTRPVEPKALEQHEDKTLWMSRTEVVCSRCGGHQGHVFDDGPAPTGLRYCVNSASLDFVPKE